MTANSTNFTIEDGKESSSIEIVTGDTRADQIEDMGQEDVDQRVESAANKASLAVAELEEASEECELAAQIVAESAEIARQYAEKTLETSSFTEKLTIVAKQITERAESSAVRSKEVTNKTRKTIEQGKAAIGLANQAANDANHSTSLAKKIIKNSNSTVKDAQLALLESNKIIEQAQQLAEDIVSATEFAHKSTRKAIDAANEVEEFINSIEHTISSAKLVTESFLNGKKYSHIKRQRSNRINERAQALRDKISKMQIKRSDRVKAYK
ncbi:MAG: hypothetical protein HOM84_03625 [Thiotrichales bacterium]|jgi:hypothetical protein|nr:hypothetical protein [Thiotrichales bacterium]MBT3612880.1 hypothetical protein [Thiotrichales bacterium]MBT3752562.1 hypothetical protein [Thiotrichales bacterium]MBT3838143.1 hypothetical protein [Thiotrichales bacterium]MBT4152174.1 hypothetical protein [Thiotrichales bacterium]